MGEKVVGEGFGQRERLTVRLRGLLRSYPRSIGILKELLQNADDAGATRVSVIWDGREHPRDKLPDPRMARLQGPALLVTNDKLFTEADFAAIRSIGESSKSEQGPKTGRFGLGFNTVYNVSDYPSFISGRWAISFDPHRETVADESEPAGKRWPLADLWGDAADWLGTFKAAGLTDLEEDHPGTIFRLPARTPEQAKESEICEEAFTHADVEQLISDLESSGDELLLFARNLLEITVFEVDSDGSLQERLSLSTLDRDEVQAMREIGNTAVEGDIAERIVVWRADCEELPRAVYRHKIEARTPGSVELRAWQVVTGLFADNAGQLLKLNERMLALREKALPWVGAALRLLPRDDGHYGIARQHGKLFCTFPLPDQTGNLPCHINGCFDLDPSRRQISTDPELYAEADRVRVAWNRALLEHAAPQAAALAISALIPDAAVAGLGAFYDLWPTLPRHAEEPWRSFAAALLSRLAELPLVRTRAGDEIEWRSLQETSLPPPLWGDDLQDALRDDGLRLPDPDIPRRLATSAEQAGVLTRRYRPEQVRAWLRVDSPLEVTIAESPRACLRERSHIVDLLQFCISDRTDDIVGLPLALCADGTLRAFGRGVEIFLAEAETRSLFAAHEAWFIDAGIQGHTRLRPSQPAQVVDMDLKRVVVELGRILAPTSENALPWSPSAEEEPNATWLTEVLRFLSAHATELTDGGIDGLTILPDRRGRLLVASTARPHLVALNDDEAELVNVLTELGMDVVSAEPPLIDAIRNLHRRYPGLMMPIGGRSLAYALSLAPKAQSALATDQRAREQLLDALANPAWIAAYEDETRQLLRRTPLLRTVRGRPVSADEPGLFLPTDFDGPAIDGLAMDFVDVGPNDRWRPLLLELEVPELDRERFLADVFLRSYADLADHDQVALLQWLRQHIDLSALERSSPETAEALRSSALIRGVDGQLYAASHLYDPGDDGAPLDSSAQVPDFDHYPGDREDWRSFFADLGLRETPQAGAILEHIDALCARFDDEQGPVEGELAELLTYVERLWLHLHGKDADEAESLAAELRTRAWLTSLPSSEMAAFTPPDRRLYRGDELVRPEQLGLVASTAPTLGASGLRPEFMTALGLPSSPPVEPVLAHLLDLSQRWMTGERGALTTELLSTRCAAIYAYVGRLEDAPSAAQLAPLADTPCIWDGARFWRADHTFAVSVAELFGDRRGFVVGEGDAHRGLERLGRRPQVQTDDIASMLGELSELSDGTPLARPDLESALRLLRRYVDLRAAEQPPSTSERSTLPVPTREGILVNSDALFVDDAPWFAARLPGGTLPLLYSKVNAETIACLGIRRLSQYTREELAETPALSGNVDRIEFCRALTTTVHHPLFAVGLERLLVAHGKTGSADLTRLSALELRPVDRLITQLRVDGMKGPLGRREVALFADDDAEIVYISADHWDTVVVALAEAINRLLGDRPGERLDNLSHLEALLRTEPADIEALLDHRRVPRAQSADLRPVAEPEEIDDLFAEIQEPEPTSEDDEASPKKIPSRAIGVERLAFVGSEELAPTASNDVSAAALDACFAYEEAAGRKVKAMPPGTPGYELQSGRISDPSARFIRVYGLDGDWDELTVLLAKRDAVAARTFGRQYWLYIVERALKPDARRIYRIQDPLPRIARYALDARWRSQAERDGGGVGPQIGWVHSSDTAPPGTIVAVERAGMFTWVTVRLDSGVQEKRFFKPAVDRVQPAS